jgi:dipeptidyl-peptidase 4
MDIQIENRAQNVLQLLRVDPQTNERVVLVEETSTSWLNLHDMLWPLSPSFRLPHANCDDVNSSSNNSSSSDDYAEGDFYFIWASERSGFQQLYLYHFHRNSLRTTHVTEHCLPLSTGGEWVVDSLDAVDEERLCLYCSGNFAAPAERHLYRVSLCPTPSQPTHSTQNGGLEATGFTRLTTTAGWHTCAVSVRQQLLVDVCSDLHHPVTMSLRPIDHDIANHNSNTPSDRATATSSSMATVLVDGRECDHRLRACPAMLAAIVPPEIHCIRSLDGTVDLLCAVYLPPGRGLTLQDYLLASTPVTTSPLTSLPKFPAIVSVYGGPHVQRVTQQWSVSADLRAQRFAQQGFVVIKCDNRGSSRRGLAFESAIHCDMGRLEVLDQQAAVEYFAALGLVDASRVGMFGWSYGGYMSAMSLCRAPQVFACAVAGAPVTSWDGYDTHYTERYMGLPQENPQGYNDSR